jgi:hypothetical protein
MRTMDETEHARQILAAEFAAAGRHDFKAYIERGLAGDFAHALAGILAGKSEGPTKQALDMAQRAIDDLRRYVFDEKSDRRVKRAGHCQESLDALSRTLGIEPRHTWPREHWIADQSDAAMADLERQGAGVLARIDAAYDHHMDPIVLGAIFASKDFVDKALGDAREQRRAVRLIERELQMEEQESDQWARKATLDGDLGANPPTFLVDVVEDLRKEIESVRAECDEHARVRESLRQKYNDLYGRYVDAQARLG